VAVAGELLGSGDRAADRSARYGSA
jgi:hypothetical protein